MGSAPELPLSGPARVLRLGLLLPIFLTNPFLFNWPFNFCTGYIDFASMTLDSSTGRMFGQSPYTSTNARRSPAIPTGSPFPGRTGSPMMPANSRGVAFYKQSPGQPPALVSAQNMDGTPILGASPQLLTGSPMLPMQGLPLFFTSPNGTPQQQQVYYTLQNLTEPQLQTQQSYTVAQNSQPHPIFYQSPGFAQNPVFAQMRAFPPRISSVDSSVSDASTTTASGSNWDESDLDDNIIVSGFDVNQLAGYEDMGSATVKAGGLPHGHIHLDANGAITAVRAPTDTTVFDIGPYTIAGKNQYMDAYRPPSGSLEALTSQMADQLRGLQDVHQYHPLLQQQQASPNTGPGIFQVPGVPASRSGGQLPSQRFTSLAQRNLGVDMFCEAAGQQLQYQQQMQHAQQQSRGRTVSAAFEMRPHNPDRQQLARSWSGSINPTINPTPVSKPALFSAVPAPVANLFQPANARIGPSFFDLGNSTISSSAPMEQTLPAFSHEEMLGLLTWDQQMQRDAALHQEQTREALDPFGELRGSGTEQHGSGGSEDGEYEEDFDDLRETPPDRPQDDFGVEDMNETIRSGLPNGGLPIGSFSAPAAASPSLKVEPARTESAGDEHYAFRARKHIDLAEPEGSLSDRDDDEDFESPPDTPDDKVKRKRKTRKSPVSSDAVSARARSKANDKRAELGCNLCGKTFTRRFNLLAHERSHAQERPFKCDLCPLAFCRKHDLKRHHRLHTGEAPYKCEECGKGFMRIESYNRHQKTVDTASKCPGLSRPGDDDDWDE